MRDVWNVADGLVVKFLFFALFGMMLVKGKKKSIFKFLKGLLPYMVIWRRFRMQMTLTVHEHGSYEQVGFITTRYLLVCVHTVSSRLINTDLYLHTF